MQKLTNFVKESSAHFFILYSCDSESDDDVRPRGHSEPARPNKFLEEISHHIRTNDCKKVRNLLRKYSGDLNEISEGEGGGLLHEAAYKGCTKCVKTLLKQGSYVNLTDHQGWTPLHAAVLGCNLKAVKCLLNKCALPNELNGDGLSSCHLAVFMNDVRVLRELIQAGGDPLQPAALISPFQLAIDLKKTIVLDYFLRLPCFLVCE